MFRSLWLLSHCGDPQLRHGAVDSPSVLKAEQQEMFLMLFGKPGQCSESPTTGFGKVWKMLSVSATIRNECATHGSSAPFKTETERMGGREEVGGRREERRETAVRMWNTWKNSINKKKNKNTLLIILLLKNSYHWPKVSSKNTCISLFLSVSDWIVCFIIENHDIYAPVYSLISLVSHIIF